MAGNKVGRLVEEWVDKMAAMLAAEMGALSVEGKAGHSAA
jgi:hypothetical protein